MLRTAVLLAAALGGVHAQVSTVSQVIMLGPDTRNPDSGTGDTGASQDRYVDLHIGFSQMYPGMKVWGDLPSSKWRHVPAWLMGMSTMLPSSIISSTKRIEWHCAPEAYTGSPYCDAYVFIYNCAGCDFRDGGLVPALVSDDWQPFRCTPTVEVSPDGPPHRMMGLYKRVPAGTIEQIVMGEETGLVTFAINRAGNDCTLLGNEDACTDKALDGQCAWIDDTCRFARCMPQGPFTTTCADRICLPDEIAALPNP